MGPTWVRWIRSARRCAAAVATSIALVLTACNAEPELADWVHEVTDGRWHLQWEQCSYAFGDGEPEVRDCTCEWQRFSPAPPPIGLVTIATWEAPCDEPPTTGEVAP